MNQKRVLMLEESVHELIEKRKWKEKCMYSASSNFA